MHKELETLLNDFGGGRQKQTEKSQLFYDLANVVLNRLNQKPYIQIQLFTEYLKEIAKRNACVNILGKE